MAIEISIDTEAGTLTLRNPPLGAPFVVNERAARRIAMARQDSGSINDALKLESAAKVLRDLGWSSGRGDIEAVRIPVMANSMPHQSSK